MSAELYVIAHPGRGVFIGYKESLVGENGNIPHFRHRATMRGKIYYSLDVARDDLEILKRRHGLRRCYVVKLDSTSQT